MTKITIDTQSASQVVTLKQYIAEQKTLLEELETERAIAHPDYTKALIDRMSLRLEQEKLINSLDTSKEHIVSLEDVTSKLNELDNIIQRYELYKDQIKDTKRCIKNAETRYTIALENTVEALTTPSPIHNKDEVR